MVHVEERNLTGWNLRAIFEAPEPDFMEAEAFFAAFGRERELDGHRVNCILTSPKHTEASYNMQEDAGIHRITAILIVRKSDVSNLHQGGNLNIDGTDYLIIGVSSPLLEVTRLELESYGG